MGQSHTQRLYTRPAATGEHKENKADREHLLLHTRDRAKEKNDMREGGIETKGQTGSRTEGDMDGNGAARVGFESQPFSFEEMAGW